MHPVPGHREDVAFRCKPLHAGVGYRSVDNVHAGTLHYVANR